MEKKYQVFISSTYKDLKKERLAAREAILLSNNFPVGMEQFGASEKRQWDIIKKDIDESDYFVLIIGKMYGTVIKDEKISYTHKEYNYAKSIGIPILAFIKDNNAKTRKGFIESDKKKEKALKKFIDEVEEDRTCAFWKNADDIRFYVSDALSKSIKSSPRPGWTRNNIKSDYEENEIHKELSDYEEKALNVLSKKEKTGIREISKELNLSMKYSRIILDGLAERNYITHYNDKKWAVLNTKDDLVTYDDYRRSIIEIMDNENYIKCCSCGDHFWYNEDYSDDIKNHVIEVLKQNNIYNKEDEDIVELVIKDIIFEADPTDDECPGCGMPPRK